MSAEHVEFLVEDRSMEAALRQLLPGVLGVVSFDVHPYQGKHDLLKRLPDRLRGYSKWPPDGWRIVVIVDRDASDCVELKGRLEAVAGESGLRTRSASGSGEYQVLNRLVIEELEAWYFGDWQAVRAAYPGSPQPLPRRPDTVILTPSVEEPGKRSSAYCRRRVTSEAAYGRLRRLMPSRSTCCRSAIRHAASRFYMPPCSRCVADRPALARGLAGALRPSRPHPIYRERLLHADIAHGRGDDDSAVAVEAEAVDATGVDPLVPAPASTSLPESQ